MGKHLFLFILLIASSSNARNDGLYLMAHKDDHHYTMGAGLSNSKCRELEARLNYVSFVINNGSTVWSCSKYDPNNNNVENWPTLLFKENGSLKRMGKFGSCRAFVDYLETMNTIVQTSERSYSCRGLEDV